MKPNCMSWLILTCALTAAGCGTDPGQRAGVHVEVPALPDTIVSTESGLIGGLADWAVHPDGSLFLLDARSRRVHVIDGMGQLRRTIGRPGQGPGELERPASLFLGGASLTVVDPGNGRLQQFTLDGDATTSEAISTCASGPAPPARGPDGTLVRPTLGFGAGLAVVCSASGEERGRLGALLAPGQVVVNMAELRAQAIEGEIPALLLNAASAVVGEDGAVWLTVSAAKQVERYDPRGDRIFLTTVEEPGFDAVLAAWIEQNREMDDFNLAGLDYLLRAREVRGDLWILTNSGERPGARLLVLSGEGQVRERLEFTHVTGAGNFVVDEERGRVYFYIPGTAEVLRVSFDVMAM
ncbi:MAG: hypothetical protein EA350_05115 [Gemmatimonadales bacterium]|nr:MAG: hypothetical protein EA350_05115 [Gemmatimonadales bacterium]